LERREQPPRAGRGPAVGEGAELVGPGGGVQAGLTHGKTDELGFSVVEGGVHVHDLNATVLHLMGLDHERLTFRYQGRDFRLTDVHGEIVRPILA
jgi:hypothetical protein